jgi:hypothetical protein
MIGRFDRPIPITDEEVQRVFGERIREMERIINDENTVIAASYIRTHGAIGLRELDRLVADYMVDFNGEPPDSPSE